MSFGPGGSSDSVRHIAQLPSQQPPDWWKTIGPCLPRSRSIVSTAAAVALTADI
jgi:hypothetical protein